MELSGEDGKGCCDRVQTIVWIFSGSDLTLLLQIKFETLVGCYHKVSDSFFVKAAAAGSTLTITDYNLCSLVSSFGKKLYLFANTNWIVPEIENGISIVK